MSLLKNLYVLLIVLTTACQLSPKLAVPKDEIYGDGAQIFIHHSKNNFSNDYEVYVDKQKVDPMLLDKRGIRIFRGEHGIDIVEKKSSKTIRHFDVRIEDATEKHFNLCSIKSTEHFSLEEKNNSENICIQNNLN